MSDTKEDIGAAEAHALTRRYVEDRFEEGLLMVPPHMHECLRRYFFAGELLDDFLECVLQNDLKGAFRHADEINRAAMDAWVAFIVSHLPIGAQGSTANVNDWVQSGGLNGRDAA